MKTGRILAASAAILAVGAAVFMLLRPTGAHADGSGALGSVGQPVHESLGADPASGPTSWTYGIPLCVADAATPATVVAVRPARTIGNGFELLGILARSFTLSGEDQAVIGVEDYPPPPSKVPGPLLSPVGLVVSNVCGPTDPRATELLVGLGLRGSDGGGWLGVEVDYDAGGDRATLFIDRDLLICGPSVVSGCDGQ